MALGLGYHDMALELGAHPGQQSSCLFVARRLVEIHNSMLLIGCIIKLARRRLSSCCQMCSLVTILMLAYPSFPFLLLTYWRLVPTVPRSSCTTSADCLYLRPTPPFVLCLCTPGVGLSSTPVSSSAGLLHWDLSRPPMFGLRAIQSGGVRDASGGGLDGGAESHTGKSGGPRGADAAGPSSAGELVDGGPLPPPPITHSLPPPPPRPRRSSGYLQ